MIKKIKQIWCHFWTRHWQVYRKDGKLYYNDFWRTNRHLEVDWIRCRDCGKEWESEMTTGTRIISDDEYEEYQKLRKILANELTFDSDYLSRLGIDGKLWADAMSSRFAIPTENLLVWTCNMIMAGYDEARRRYEKIS